VQHRVAIQLGEKGFVLALGAAQHGVEQALGPGLFQRAGAADRFADGRVLGDAAVQQLVETDQQQRLDILVGGLEGLFQQLVRQQLQARLPACGAEGQVLRQGSVMVLDLVQLRRQAAAQRGLAGQHGGQGTRRGQTWIH